MGGRRRGKNKRCCSGGCHGPKPKNGDKDKSRCVAHDRGALEFGDGGCLAQHDSFGPGGTFCTTSAGEETGQCWLTTGGAGYGGYGGSCSTGACRKDADCVDAACIVVPGSGCNGGDTYCVGVGLCNGA